jgi:hypothetical protein
MSREMTAFSSFMTMQSAISSEASQVPSVYDIMILSKRQNNTFNAIKITVIC